HNSGKKRQVWVDETRPLLQGSRLTAWELMNADIPMKIITDSAAGSLMRRGKVDLILAGANRITTAGDVANTIGTYPLAVLARENEIPFYVAAPLSTIDMELEDGASIPLEESDGDEITQFKDSHVDTINAETYITVLDISSI